MRALIYNKNPFSSKVEATNQSSVAAVQEVEGKEGDEHSFEVLKPSRWEASESKLEGVNKRRLHVAEGEMEGRGVLSYFGAKVDVGEGVKVTALICDLHDLVVGEHLNRTEVSPLSTRRT